MNIDLIFLELFNRSIAAGWLILAVIGLRLLLKRAPRWTFCILWALVAVRLVSPVSPESAFSLIPSVQTISPATVQYAREPEITSGVDFINQAVNPLLQDSLAPSPEASVNPLYVLTWLAGILWAVGGALFLGHMLVSYGRIRRRLREAVPLRDRIWLCDAVKSPFILGVLRPRIYLPSGLGEGQMDYVLAHEEAHLKRRDHWWKLLGYLLLAVYWFHPLMWAAYALFCKDLELACDERVIRDMDLAKRKAYSHALVSCSVQKKGLSACPLAFGEIGVKERVLTVLNYKRPAFWLILAAILACALAALCFLTNPRQDTFDLRIVVPPGSQEDFCYSQEEFSPLGRSIRVSAGEGLSDTAFVLQESENHPGGAHSQPIYLTSGMPVKTEAQKNTWYRIGVRVQNPSQEELNLWIRVKGVEVRIADNAGNPERDPDEDSRKTDTENTPAAEDLTDSLSAIYAAILEANNAPRPEREHFPCCDFVLLAREQEAPENESAPSSQVTFYGWAMYEEYRILETGLEDRAGSHLPLALTFELDEAGGYHLKEYWRPRDGSYFAPDVREKFPASCAEEGIDSQKYVWQQIQSCYRQAVEFAGLDTDAVIESLLEEICSAPGTSSNPQDYIDSHALEYRELLYYREYTLRHCFGLFQQGGETGLKGQIMARACEEILQSKGRIPLDADTSETGQLWYDTLLAHAGNRVTPYLN